MKSKNAPRMPILAMASIVPELTALGTPGIAESTGVLGQLGRILRCRPHRDAATRHRLLILGSRRRHPRLAECAAGRAGSQPARGGGSARLLSLSDSHAAKNQDDRQRQPLA